MKERDRGEQSSRKRRIRRIFMPIFAFCTRKISFRWFLFTLYILPPDIQTELQRRTADFWNFFCPSKSIPEMSKNCQKNLPTFNELYDVCPAYLLEIRYLCWLSFKDVPLSACGSFIDIGVKRRDTLLMAAWSLCVFVTCAELINWCLYNQTFFCDTRKYSVKLYEVIIIFKYSRLKILNYYFAKNVCLLKTPQHFRELPSEIK